MTQEGESSFNLNCFDDDFDKNLEKINEYYECMLKLNDYAD